MEEEFYAIIKLVSGEEILSKVSPCDEKHRILLILDNPVVIETMTIRQLGLSTLKISPWIKYSNDDMFIIDMEKVITITEIKEESLIEMHEKFVIEKNKKSHKTKPSHKMGFVSSVEDARLSLEKIYKLT